MIMKINTKKILTITIVIVFIISVVYIFYLNGKSSDLPNISPSEPKLTEKYKGKFPITLVVDKSEFDFPKKLPFLEFESSPLPLTEEYAKKVAGHLNFPGEPTTINDPIDGNTYFWKNDKGIIFIYTKSRKVRFSANALNSAINQQLSDAAIAGIAESIITNNEILDENIFRAGSVKFLEQIPDGEGYRETTKEKAVLYQVNILPKSVNYEFISSSSVEPDSYIQLRQDGSIYSLQITKSPNIKNGITEYNLKNYDEVKTSLDEAVLIELRGDTALLSDLPDDLIKSVEINKVEIAYLVESAKSTSFQPVYKLSGNATLNNLQFIGIATFYLPAIIQNQP